MNYALGYAFNIHDMFAEFDTSRLDLDTKTCEELIGNRHKEVIAKNLNLIYGYDKANQTKKDFFKAFDNFVTSMIGETDIEETDEDDEEPKKSVKEGVLDKFIGFKKGFFD